MGRVNESVERERWDGEDGGASGLSGVVGVICFNLLHVNLSEQQEPDYPSNNGHTLIC